MTIDNKSSSVRSGKNPRLTSFIKPMLAKIGVKPFDDENWIFETKWDGYRAIAEIDNTTKLYSRNGLSFAQLYPTVVDALKLLPKGTIIDGEIIVLNENNQPDFQRLQQFGFSKGTKIQFQIFDCLKATDKMITSLPLVERKQILRMIIPRKHTILKYSDHAAENGIRFFQKMKAKNLEGMIAKRAASTYKPGTRTDDWLKIKNHNTQEAIIIGYTAPRGGRKYFGALLLAIMDKTELCYIGHIGTGFTEKILYDVYQKLQPLKRTSPPITKKISLNAPVTWVQPKLVCSVKFSELTQEGILRHPVFQGLRIDKDIKEVKQLDIKS